MDIIDSGMLIYSTSRIIHVMTSGVWSRQAYNTNIPCRDASLRSRHSTRNNIRSIKAWKNPKGREDKKTCSLSRKEKMVIVIYEEFPDQIVVKTITLGGIKRK